jgi:hypothetical protein
MLTQDRLREVIDYNEDTGLLIWKFRPELRKEENTKNCGKAAGTRGPMGYIRVAIDKKIYAAHRLAWLWMTGEWPENEIDHINMIKHDNRWGNLRHVSRSQNQMNVSVRSDSSTGLKGVYYDKSIYRWRPKIMIDGKRYTIGTFDCPAAASFAYQIAADKIHKEFARVK